MSPAIAAFRPPLSRHRAFLPYAGLPRLLAGTGPVHDLADHLRLHGPLPVAGDPAAIIDEVAAAGLTGRGGAAFPAARKLAAVRAAGRGDAVVVANGAEGEPASRKDVTLLWHAPHLVLDGLQVAARACDAATAILYVHGGRPDLHRLLQQVIRARRVAGTDRLAVETRRANVPERSGAKRRSARRRLRSSASTRRFTASLDKV